MRKEKSLVNVHKERHEYSKYKNAKKHTLADLMTIRAKYNDNFEKLLEAFGTAEHEKYIREERRLNWMERTVMKELGLLKEQTNR